MRIDVSDASFAELVRRARSEAVASFAHQDVPFERLVTALSPPCDLGRHELFTTTLTMHPLAFELPRMPGADVSELAFERRTTAADLCYELAVTESGIRGEVTYDAAALDDPTVVAVTASFVEILTVGAEDPDRRVVVAEDGQRVGSTSMSTMSRIVR